MHKLHFFALKKPKCVKYWPEPAENEEKGECAELYDYIHVKFINIAKFNNDYVLREFLVTDNKTKKSRTVFQFHYLSWSGKKKNYVSLN